MRSWGVEPGRSESLESAWAVLDQFDSEELFLKKIPMLKKCPHFLKGRLRHCWAVALRERLRAQTQADADAEGRPWKLFGMVPLMLLHRP